MGLDGNDEHNDITRPPTTNHSCHENLYCIPKSNYILVECLFDSKKSFPVLSTRPCLQLAQLVTRSSDPKQSQQSP